MAKIQVLAKVWSNKFSPSFAGGNARGQSLWKFLIKLPILLPYNPAMTLLDIYPNKLKT
jgi:hypothetical protein